MLLTCKLYYIDMIQFSILSTDLRLIIFFRYLITQKTDLVYCCKGKIHLRFDHVALGKRWSFHLQLLSIDSLEVESEWNSSTTHDDTSATTAAIYRNQCFKNKSNTTFQYCIFIFFPWTYKYDTSTYAHILIQMSILNEKTYLPTCTYHEYFDINIFL